MGWLKALMKQHQQTSFEVLGEALKRAGAVGSRGKKVANKRTLANLLRKVDAGQPLPRYLEAVLAKVLDVEVDALHDAEREGLPNESLPGELRWPGTDIVLDATHDPLPPGYPAKVLDPLRWDRHWWAAPRLLGTEARALGAWLGARHRGVHVVAAMTFADALAEVPERGAALVILDRVTGDEHHLAAELSRHVGVMVVAPRAPVPDDSDEDDERPARPAREESKWTEVAATTLDVGAVLAWFGTRVEGGGFELARATALLNEPRFAPARATPGRVIEIACAFDEVGAKLATSRGRKLLEHLLKHRSDAATQALGKKPWLFIERLVTTLAARPKGLHAPIDDELLDTLSPEVDVSALRKLSHEGDDATVGRSIRAALDRSPAKVGAALVLLGWLEPLGPSRWRVAEHWLLRELLVELIDQWIDDDQQQLADAIVGHDVAPLIIERLHDRFDAGDLRVLESAVARVDFADLTTLYRFFACVRAASVAAFGEHDPTWYERLGKVFAAYSDRRRAYGRPTESYVAWRHAHGWTHRKIGALAVEPFRSTVPDAEVGKVVRHVEVHLEELGHDPRIVTRLLAFAETLRARHRPSRAWIDLYPLQLVWLWCDAVARNEAPPFKWTQLLACAARRPILWDLLVRVAGARLDDALRAMWTLPLPETAERAEAWAKTPGPLREGLLRAAPESQRQEAASMWWSGPVDAVPDALWPAIIADAMGSARDERRIASMPERAVAGVVASGVFARKAFENERQRLIAKAQWRAFPEATRDALMTLTPPWRATSLLDNAPAHSQPELLARMLVLMPDPEHRNSARTWVQGAVRDRVDGWREAWAVLLATESVLGA